MFKKTIRNIIYFFSKFNFNHESKIIGSLKTKAQVLKYQKEQLEKLLLHAYKNVFYYHKVFNKIGLIKNNRVDFLKFQSIPILTKDIMRKNLNNLTSRDIKKRNWFYDSSGGSTGEPVKFIQDFKYKNMGNAVLSKYASDFLGIDYFNDKKIVLWGSERDLLKGSIDIKAKFQNWLENTVFLNSFLMDVKKMDSYIKKINSFKPVYIKAYASAIYQLSKYIKDKKIKMHSPRVIITSAEVLEPQMRKTVEGVFNTKIYNFYGSRENLAIAAECKRGNLHSFPYWTVLEVVDEKGGLVKPGKSGKVLVTNLHNFSMPFIRFEIGDLATTGSKNCKCKKPGDLIKSIVGRTTGVMYRYDGTIISGPALTLTFNAKKWVKAFQIIQEDYLKVKILVVKNRKPVKTDINYIENKFKKVLGDKVKVSWKYVKAISKTKSGKYQYIRSLVKR